MKEAVRVRSLRKQYRRFGLGPLDLDVAPGEVVAVSGANGSGKSTLLLCLAGMLRPDGGTVEISGRGWPGESGPAKDRVGFVSDGLKLHPRESLRWNASLAASLGAKKWDAERFRSLSERLGLVLDERAGALSRGRTLRALLALTLARRPDVLVLDEATAAIDSSMRSSVRRFLRESTREDGVAILFASHLDEDTDDIADRVLYLEGGSVCRIEERTKEAER
ncbi:MAG: ABC transporter ATP-binding protein [Candidatus Eisenbacteria bacterium]